MPWFSDGFAGSKKLEERTMAAFSSVERKGKQLMSDQLERHTNQRVPHLQAWLYWIDTDGMKIGMAMSLTSWIILLVQLWFVPVSVALLLFGHAALSIILALGEIALLNLFFVIEVPFNSRALFLVALVSIGLPLVSIGCIIWGHLSVGGVALLTTMVFRLFSHLRFRTTRRWTRRSMLIECVSILLALGALVQVTLPLLGNRVHIMTILLSLLFTTHSKAGRLAAGAGRLL
jgi:hypothetical protein